MVGENIYISQLVINGHMEVNKNIIYIIIHTYMSVHVCVREKKSVWGGTYMLTQHAIHLLYFKLC